MLGDPLSQSQSILCRPFLFRSVLLYHGKLVLLFLLNLLKVRIQTGTVPKQKQAKQVRCMDCLILGLKYEIVGLLKMKAKSKVSILFEMSIVTKRLVNVHRIFIY